MSQNSKLIIASIIAGTLIIATIIVNIKLGDYLRDNKYSYVYIIESNKDHIIYVDISPNMIADGFNKAASYNEQNIRFNRLFDTNRIILFLYLKQRGIMIDNTSHWHHNFQNINIENIDGWLNTNKKTIDKKEFGKILIKIAEPINYPTNSLISFIFPDKHKIQTNIDLMIEAEDREKAIYYQLVLFTSIMVIISFIPILIVILQHYRTTKVNN
jgi:hypothetical protein